jgi:DNA helicase-2/ATP-dependent DNA helicase PcrA
MDDRIRAAAEAAARQLLLRYKEDSQRWLDDKTPLDDIADWLGIQVVTFHPDDYPTGTYGFLEPGEDLIWLCRDLPQALRRFTLAHEIGHAVLHRATDGHLGRPLPVDVEVAELAGMPELSPADPCQQPDVQEELPGPLDPDLLEDVQGAGMTYDPRSERELAANIFAAELLMPMERVRELYLDQQTAPDKLTGIFDVSNAAMLNRLATLLILADGWPGAVREGGETGRGQELPRYDEFQQAAIEAATPALIVAGPGSGKTSTLIGRVEYLIARQQVRPENILALTFSRKAAQEMTERLQTVLCNYHPSLAQGAPVVSTFHAFCANVLRMHGDLVGLRPAFTLLDETEGYFLLRQLAGRMQLFHYRNLQSPAYYFPDFLKAIARAKDELVTPERYQRLAQTMLEQAHDAESELNARKALEVASIYTLYEEGLGRRGESDFGGLIMQTVRLFEEHPQVSYALRQQYQYILVDEFQDINRASGVLLRQLAGEEGRVWVVGDANQAIYSFRGASPANIANFQQDYPDARVLPLSRNYRSRPDIVRLAESFRRQKLEAGVETGDAASQAVRLTQAGIYVTLAEAEDNANELAGLVADIRHKHARGIAYDSIAILCRTRARVSKITRALKEAGLPAIEQASLLSQSHIKDLISIMLLLTDSSGMGILRAARQKEHALQQSDIEALLLASREQESPPGSLISRGEALRQLSIEGCSSLMRLANILRSLAQTATSTWSLLAQYLFIETFTLRDLLRTNAAGQHSDILAGYASFLQIARRFDQQQARYTRRPEQSEERGELAPSPAKIQEQVQGLLDYLRVMLSFGQEGGSRQQLGADNKAPVITVMTIHASKGLEFPVVYLPGLISRNFPLQKQGDPVPMPTGMLPTGDTEKDIHEVGEACLFYVGVTRARDQLVLSYSKRNGKQGAKLSPYIEDLLAGLPEERIARLKWQDLLATSAGEEEDRAGSTEPLADPAEFSRPGMDFLAAVKPEKLHAAAIETYQRCPRQYLYSYIYGFSSKEGGYRLFWQAAQKTLEVLQQKRAASAAGADLPTLEEARALYMQHWQALGGDALPFAAVYEEHGHEVTDQLRRLLLASSDTHWTLRPDLTVEVAGRTISVPVDRIETPSRADRPVKFVRTRFGKSKEKPAAGMRELLYARGYRQHYSEQSIEMHLQNLSTGETLPITLTPKKEQSLYNELEQAILGIERDEYPPAPDARTCPDCAFYLICPA